MGSYGQVYKYERVVPRDILDCIVIDTFVSKDSCGQISRHAINTRLAIQTPWQGYWLLLLADRGSELGAFSLAAVA